MKRTLITAVFVLVCLGGLHAQTAPRTAEDHVERGTDHFNYGNFDRAIVDFSEAIRLDPYSCDAYFMRGLAYFNNEDYDRAVADFEAALRINPDDADTKRELDLARQKQTESR